MHAPALAPDTAPAAGYLARPLGGIVMAHFGDLSGRKRMFMSGLSFSYNVAYAIAGGLTPVLLSYAMCDNANAPIQYMTAMAAMGVVLGLWLMLRPPTQPS